MKPNKKQLSYFAEERNRNGNPNFFNNMRTEDLRRKVKRIIQDIQRGNIEEADYVYFKNDKIISACLTESWEQWRNATTEKDALMYYLNVPLMNNIIPYPNRNIYEERANASNVLAHITNKECIWLYAYQTFLDISKGADVRACLTNIMALNSNLFYDL